jgi:hypothetical protein
MGTVRAVKKSTTSFVSKAKLVREETDGERFSDCLFCCVGLVYFNKIMYNKTSQVYRCENMYISSERSPISIGESYLTYKMLNIRY